MTGPVIFVDDDPDLRRATAQVLKLAGFEVRVFEGAEAALSDITEDFEGPVVTDIRMPRMNGLQLFERVRAIDPELPVLLVTGHGDIELAVAALKDGAYDFISKPFDGERLATAVAHAAEKRRLVIENRRLRAAVAVTPADLPLIGDDPGIRRLRETIRQVADADVDVLVLGETGSGKEVVARLLHDWSRRKVRNLVALNCGALPETVLESELFGHEAGAFTGADRKRVGRIEHASGGTLFLDEIESCSPAIQVKLLRVLETREVEPLGTNERRRLDLRVVAATKVDLGDPTVRGSFREDLYYRLNVVTLRIPPLRERRGDVPLLFAHFLKRAADRFGRPMPEIGAGVRNHLMRHDWPGNVRELLHFADRSALGLASETDTPALPVAAAGASLPERLDAFEAELLRATLRQHNGDVRATIEALGVPRKTFYDKLKRHGIQRADFE
jgi:two-component system C4-dicarboxylate transport response regulator DctD